MNPKLSIGSWAFAFGPFEAQPWPFEAVLRYAREAGYDGVEVNGFAPHPIPESYPSGNTRKQLRQLITSYGLNVSGYAPAFGDVPPATTAKERYLDKMKRYMEFAHDLGTHTLRIDTVTSPAPCSAQQYDNRWKHLADVWSSSAELAAKEDFRIVWEFEPGFWLNKPSEILGMVKEVNSPHFQLLFDTSHAYMCAVVGARQSGAKDLIPGGVAEFAKMAEPYIGHLHLIDSDGTLHDDETSTHSAFGKGLVDFEQLLRVMKPAFSKLEWWGVDFCFNAEAEAWGKEAVPFIRECIRKVEGQGESA